MTATLAPSRRLLPARRLGTPPAGASPPNATIAERLDLGPTMARFSIAPDGGVPAFAPGQYFAIGLERDGRLIQRPYSAASQARDPVLEFAIRLVPEGALTPALWTLRPGARVRIGPPKGLFRLADGDHLTSLLLATGTGIAPLVAMARALWSEPVPRRTIVVHGVGRADELAYRRELAAWSASMAGWVYVPVISRPGDAVNAGWSGRVGRLDTIVPSLIDELGLDPEATVAYLCGNPAMIAGLAPRLIDLGLPASAVRSEAY
ncbi:MAG TPA: FAD-binding oxidoreductase [Candidatus Limnocylindrales bacterium]|nr:FAD-binding oxidoreductase [Candidatus Limnocylindrales bacterium]